MTPPIVARSLAIIAAMMVAICAGVI